MESTVKTLLFSFLLLAGCQPSPPTLDADTIDAARINGRASREALLHSYRYLRGWMRHADPATGLIPRNLGTDSTIWNAWDSAADNYPFLVLTSRLTARPLFDSPMHAMLDAERRLTTRAAGLPDVYDFRAGAFAHPEIDTTRLIFGASEYIKDGLLPLTEWLGESPWSARMIELLDAMWAVAPVPTEFGPIVSENVEVNGEMLQTLSRVYWMTGDEKYLDWAMRLGDYYLLGRHHPTRDLERLRLRDHGCEIVSGLVELYVTTHFARPDKKARYEAPVHAMLDRILEVGRDDTGLFYNVIAPKTGEVIQAGAADTWGYTMNGLYAVYLIDGTPAYRDATLKALRALQPHYADYDWEHGSADGDADAIESALNLYNREAEPDAGAWIDRQIRRMWAKQQADGIVEGWHGDGNFARTSIMYAFWKTKGVHAEPWRADVRVGGVMREDGLYLSVSADSAWDGRLFFDRPRHRDVLHLPIDWPRINQFPEWYTVDATQRYLVYDMKSDARTLVDGRQLLEGFPVSLPKDEERALYVRSW
ncbi:MAG: hypothetical protein R2834_00990 [Rhodothermales bacterium]